MAQSLSAPRARCFHDPRDGVMKTRAKPHTIVNAPQKLSRGRVSPWPQLPGGGVPRHGVRREVPVLDGSIVQLYFRGRRSARPRVLQSNPADILLDRLLA